MKRGSVVRSLLGHDKGTLYIVLNTKNGFAELCDGKNKLLSNPKKKNIKHLEETGKVVNLETYSPLYDAHIRNELKGL